ncbi:MAG: hypothetical protein F6K42_28885 [Leptolyngbya sp. SIO1D8]|nr:hypothetical protein [Leptolyngbya sp. SIO1D8]
MTALSLGASLLCACQGPLSEQFRVQEESSTVEQLRSDPFRGAVNDAMAAAEKVQTASTVDEWQSAVELWQSAIALMQAVSESSPDYETAQQKVVEYGINKDYALSQIEQADFNEFVVLVKAEATSKAQRYRETHISLFEDCINDCGFQSLEVLDNEIRIFFRPVPNHIAAIGPDNPQLTKEILDFASPFKVWVGAPPSEIKNVPEDALACELDSPHNDNVAIYGVDNWNTVIAIWRPCIGDRHNNTLVGLEFN